MKITFLELRRDPAKLLEALDRNEVVTISRRGRDIASVSPSPSKAGAIKVSDHPAFGMWADREELNNPTEHVRKMRKGRFGDL